MTETEPESLGKMEKTVSKTEACDPTLEAKTELCLSKEETLGCDFSDFKTPLHPTSGHKSRLAWAQNSCDSGFNSVQSGAFSDRSSSVGSSVRSSPEPSTSLSGRRVTLGTCEFSPVTRESFPIIRSRKLDFHSKDLFTDSSNLHFVDEELKNQESYSEDSETQEKRECVDDGFVEELNNSLSPVSPGLFCFQNDTVPRQRQRINDIDLEVSLQDMSLEESTSSSSSLSSRSGSGSNSPFHHTEIKKDICQKKEEPVPSISCSSSETNEVPTHILNWIACVSKTPNCNEQNIPSLSSCKTNFMTTLHLTEAHDTSTDSAHSVLSSPSHPPLNQTSSKSVIKPPSHTCFQPQFFPSESSLIKNLSEVCPSSLQAGAHPCKSPCKRTGGNELDVDHILSPTKSRKMESCQEQSSISCAARKIFHGDLPANYASGPNTDKLQSMLLSSLDHPKRTGITFGHKPSLGRCPGKVHQETNRYAEPGTPACNLSKRLQKVLQMSLPSEPSRLIGRNIGVVKFDIIEALHKNFNLCVAKILSFLPPADLIRLVFFYFKNFHTHSSCFGSLKCGFHTCIFFIPDLRL